MVNFIIIIFFKVLGKLVNYYFFTPFRDEKAAGKALPCVDDIPHLK